MEQQSPPKSKPLPQKDYLKLIPKLFISPTYSSKDTPLMVSMQFLKIIIDECRQQPRQYQFEILYKILGYFEKQQTNSLLLYHHDLVFNEEKGILEMFVEWIYKLIKNEQEVLYFLSSLAMQSINLGQKQLSKLTKTVSKNFHHGNFDILKTKLLHELVNLYFTSSSFKKLPPELFFFYGCNESSCIHSLENEQIKIKNEMSLMFNFCMLRIGEQSICRICSFKTDKEEIGIYAGKGIVIRNETTGQQILEQLESISIGEWKRIIVHLNHHQTVAFLDNQEIIRDKSLIKKEKQRKIFQYCFGEDLFGFMYGIVVLDKIFPLEKLPMQGLNKWSSLVKFKQKSLLSSSILSIFPFATFQNRQCIYAFDIFNKNHSVVGDNIILYKKYLNQMNYQGKFYIILPLFFIARFYEKQGYQNHLEKLLSIFVGMLVRYKDDDKLEQFFMILGGHIANLAHLFTENCLILYSQIESKLQQSNKIYFIRYVVFNSLISQIHDDSLLNSYFNMIIKKYQNNKSLALRANSLMDVIFWAIKSFENKKYYCCGKHYTNESLIIHDFSFDQIEQIQCQSFQIHFQYIENIASVILEYAIIDNEEKVEEEIKNLARLFLHKYSTCLYNTILRLIKKQISKFKTDIDLASLFNRCNLMSFLGALAQKTVDHQIIGQIIFLLLYCSHKTKEKKDITVFIGILFKRLEDSYRNKFNFMKCGSLKIRKQSSENIQQIVSENQSQSEIKKSTPKKINTKILDKVKTSIHNLDNLLLVLINNSLGIISQFQQNQHQKFVNEDGIYLLYHALQLLSAKGTVQLLFLINKLMDINPKNGQNLSKYSIFWKLTLKVMSLHKENQQIQSNMLKLYKKLILLYISQEKHLGDIFFTLKVLSKDKILFENLLFETFYEITKNQNLQGKYLVQIMNIMIYEHSFIPFQQQILINKLRLQLCLKLFEVLPEKYPQMKAEKSRYHQIIDFKGSYSPLNSYLFNLIFSQSSQEKITFMFDTLLPKIVLGMDIETSFDQQCFKNVYQFQIFIYMVLQAIQKSSTEQESLKKLVDGLVSTFILFSCIEIVKQRDEHIGNIGLVRMVLFFSSFFLQKSKKNSEFKQIYENGSLQLWNFVFGFVRDAAVQEKCDEFKSLSQKLKLKGLQIDFCQTFHIFLRNKNNQCYYDLPKIIEIKTIQDVKVVISQEIFTLLIGNQSFQFLLDSCMNKSHKQIKEKFQKRISHFQNKISQKQTKKESPKLFKEIQTTFDVQNFFEEELRLKYLHDHQCMIRKYHSKWEKYWKNMRIYHNLYGFFMAQRNNPNNFMYEPKQLINKNFGFKMSKYNSKSGINPILQAKINQPWHVIKNRRFENSKEISCLVEMMKPSQSYRKKVDEDKENNPFNNLWKFLKKMRVGKSFEKQTEYQVIWIKSGKKAKGKVSINSFQQIVQVISQNSFWYDSIKQQDSHLAFEKFSLSFNKEMVKTWRLDIVVKISLRRYMMEYHALEIMLNNTKSVYLYFLNHNEKQFLAEIEKIRYENLTIYGDKIRANKIEFYSEKWLNDFNKTEDWINRKISNMEYLISVNKSASRGIYDISQYPVFPWVCEMNNEKQPKPRDLTKTMGSLGSQQRRNIVKEKYLSRDPFSPVPPFHFGTHYSSPGVVFNFLIRLSPFHQYCKNLQGGKYDIPDRLFSSFINSWKSAFNEVSDVRQLLPQFYYLPQCLINLEEHNFGITQTGQVINHVQLPPWASKNPYYFIIQLRQMLECEQSSRTLSSWVDLIFGFKQKGQQAQDNFNVYYYLTYEDYSDSIKQEEDTVRKKSCEAQIVHFGQIPPQIFEKPHIQKSNGKSGFLELRVQEKIVLMNSLQNRLVGLHRYGSELTLIKRSEINVLSTSKSPAVLTKSSKYNLEKTICTPISIEAESFYNIKKQAAKVTFLNKHQFILYGYLTNEFRVINKINGHIDFSDSVDSPINCILVNEDGNLMLAGCESGLLFVFQIDKDGKDGITMKKVHIQGFPYGVTYISEWDGFFAVCFGCHVAIYKIERSLYYLAKKVVKPSVKFFRSFKNNLPIKAAFISSCPLYSLIFYDNANIKVYSINGQFIKSLQSSARTMDRLKDQDGNDMFLYQEDERIILVSCPDLRCISQIQIKNYLQVFGKYIVFKKEMWKLCCLDS